MSNTVNDNDVKIKVLTGQLLNFQSKFKKSKEEIGEVYVKCSGNLEKMRSYLKNPDSVRTWDPLEDLALAYPDNSL